jgi:hypothetical protein
MGENERLDQGFVATLARLARDPKHLDSVVDVAGYAAVLREVTR